MDHTKIFLNQYFHKITKNQHGYFSDSNNGFYICFYAYTYKNHYYNNYFVTLENEYFLVFICISIFVIFTGEHMLGIYECIYRFVSVQSKDLIVITVENGLI